MVNEIDEFTFGNFLDLVIYLAEEAVVLFFCCLRNAWPSGFLIHRRRMCKLK